MDMSNKENDGDSEADTTVTRKTRGARGKSGKPKAKFVIDSDDDDDALFNEVKGELNFKLYIAFDRYQ